MEKIIGGMPPDNYMENDYVEIWIEKGIIIEVFKPDTVLDLRGGQKVVEDRLKVSNQIVMPMLVDMTQLISIDSETRKWMATAPAVKYLSAGAFLLKSIINRLAFNTFTKFDKPIVPVKAFTKKDKAIRWLEHYKNIN